VARITVTTSPPELGNKSSFHFAIEKQQGRSLARFLNPAQKISFQESFFTSKSSQFTLENLNPTSQLTATLHFG